MQCRGNQEATPPADLKGAPEAGSQQTCLSHFQACLALMIGAPQKAQVAASCPVNAELATKTQKQCPGS
jgi:hypothetical protein